MPKDQKGELHMGETVRKKEIREAIAAGEKALTSLRRAREILESAGSWGIFDMAGGGIFASMTKRSKISDAKMELELAKMELNRFSRELQDVRNSLSCNIDIGGVLSVADVFFDNFLVDWMVQSKIKNAKAQVSQAISKVERVILELRQELLKEEEA